MINLAQIIKYILESNIINFLIMLYILYIILKKIDINAFFEKSVKSIKALLEKSEQEKSQSQKIFTNAKLEYDKLPKEIEDIEKFAKQKSEVFAKQFEQNKRVALDNIDKNIEKIINIEGKNISNTLKIQTLENSINNAKQNILDKLNSNYDLHVKFIEESLEELDKVDL